MALPARSVADTNCQLNWELIAGLVFHGEGSPEGVVTAKVGATYHRTDGGAGTSFYVKESGAGTTGWVAK